MNKGILFLFIILIVITACNESTNVEPKNNNTYFFGGEAVEFQLEKTNISINESIVITLANYTGEIYMLSFCDVPFNMLMKTDKIYKYVYPTQLDCADPENITFSPGIGIPIQEIPFANSIDIGPGTYLVRIYYSTYGPMQYLREHDIMIEIK